MYVCRRVRESRRLPRYTQRQLCGSCAKPLCFSALFSISRDRYRVISRHRIILISPHFSTFANLVHLRFFSPSHTRAVWRTSSFYLVSARLCLTSMQILQFTPSTYTLHATHAIYLALPLGPIYFRTQVHSLLCQPYSLFGISAGEQPVSCLL